MPARSKHTVVLIAGARPNFMKVAPVLRALRRRAVFDPVLVHTGQHYDVRMSDAHFRDLELPSPDIHLNVGSGPHGRQTALVMERLEPVLIRKRPSLVLVVGDVNSTLAAALTAVKLRIPVAHVEAGLRSRDREMPEEINRIVTDSLSDFLFTHCREADRNLRAEGISRRKIFFVGNVMIDTLDRMLPRIRSVPPLTEEPYGLITLHRPANVDSRGTLKGIFEAFRKISRDLPLYFPVHPRTRKQLASWGIRSKSPRLHLTEPMPYLAFLAAMARARLVLTDSGGIQEETTALGVPCLTLRKTSERMITVRQGTNRIVGDDPSRILRAARAVLNRKRKSRRRPPLWDGRAAERIAAVLAERLR